MLALTCLKAVALAFSLMPQGQKPPEQLRKLPTPAEVHQEITDRLLANYRKSLAVTTNARKNLEKQRDEAPPDYRASYSDLIARYKEMEADCQRRIESLERSQLAQPGPTPVMPLLPSERAKPKPPIRD